MSKIAITDFAQIFVYKGSIYLFGSYLRFKSLYKFLGIKLYDLLLNLQNAPLKFKIQAFKILILIMIKFTKKGMFFYEC